MATHFLLKCVALYVCNTLKINLSIRPQKKYLPGKLSRRHDHIALFRFKSRKAQVLKYSVMYICRVNTFCRKKTIMEHLKIKMIGVQTLIQ